MKALIVYYSLTGNTKIIAKDLARALGADTEEIVDLQARSGLLRYMFNGRDGMQKKLTSIGHVARDPKNYDLVILGTPIWVNMTPATRTYLTNFRDQFKRVAFFCTMGGSESENTFKDMEELCQRKPVATMAISSSEVKTNEYHKKLAIFINELV